MCPERQLLSVYFDGELPSPWKEKMETHIAGCAHCAHKLDEYRHNSLTPTVDSAAVGAAQDRVWQKLESGMEQPVRRFMPAAAHGGELWRRRVSIPLPAAAAALLIIAAALLWLVRTPGKSQTSIMSIASETEFDTPGIIPVSNMEEVLQYLGANDTGEMLILRLPESRNFANYGEPAIIRAADYSSQAANRNMPGWRKP